MHCGTLVLRSAATRTGSIGLGAACRFHIALGASAAISGPATAVTSAAPGRTVITTPTSAATSAADPAQCAPAVTASGSRSATTSVAVTASPVTSPAHIGSPI